MLPLNHHNLLSKLLNYCLRIRCYFLFQPNGTLPSLPRRLLVWLFRETFTHVLFLQGLFGRSVAWRTRKFKLSVGGKAKILNHNSYPD